MTAAEQKQFADLVSPLEKRAADREAERTKGLAAALASEPKLGESCPIQVSLPDPRAPRSGGLDTDRMNREVRTLVRVDLTLRTRDNATTHSPLGKLFTGELAMAKRQTFAEASKRIAELSDDKFWDYDIVIVKDAQVDAVRSGDGKFESGEIRGRAFMCLCRAQGRLHGVDRCGELEQGQDPRVQAGRRFEDRSRRRPPDERAPASGSADAPRRVIYGLHAGGAASIVAVHVVMSTTAIELSSLRATTIVSPSPRPNTVVKALWSPNSATLCTRLAALS